MARLTFAALLALAAVAFAQGGGAAPDAGTVLPPAPVPGFAPAKAPRPAGVQPDAGTDAASTAMPRADAGTALPPPPVPGFAPAKAPRVPAPTDGGTRAP